MRLMRVRPAIAAVIAVLAISTTGLAQPGTAWRVPAPVKTVDFSANNRDCKAVFLDDGLAKEVAVEFLMIQQPRVAIVAQLPEPGQFKVEQVNPEAQVDLKNVRVEGGRGSAEVVARLAPMSREDVDRRIHDAIAQMWDPLKKQLQPAAEKMDKKTLRAWLIEHRIALPTPRRKEDEEKEYREAYVSARILEDLEPELHEKLNQLAERRTSWITAQERARLEKKKGRPLIEAYQELLTFDLLDEYLERSGFGVETTPANFRARLSGRALGLYIVLSGQIASASSDAAVLSRTFTSAEMARFRSALSVRLACRFYPAVDPQDPNGQWFNGQRVACRAKGVASIALRGKLDPKRHDRVDWWILEGFNAQAIRLDYARGGDFRVDPPFVDEHGARLRVVATGDKAVEYSLELRPVNPSSGDLKVVIHEPPDVGERKFPY